MELISIIECYNNSGFDILFTKIKTNNAIKLIHRDTLKERVLFFDFENLDTLKLDYLLTDFYKQINEEIKHKI